MLLEWCGLVEGGVINCFIIFCDISIFIFLASTLHLDLTSLYLVHICVVDVGSAQFNCLSFYLSVILINLEQRTRQKSEDTIVNVVITD